LTPGLLIGASVAATLIWERAPRARRWIAACIIVTAFASVSWAVAFSTIYANEDSRVTASRYLLQQVRAGELILTEPYDVGLPLPVVAAPEYTVEVMPLMDEASQGLLSKYVSKIASASWIVITSQRNYGSLPRLPQRFPLVCPYYHALLDGSLGFQLVERFSNYPMLFGLRVDTRNAEETFTVFDHPEVFVFHRIMILSAFEIENQLKSHRHEQQPSCKLNEQFDKARRG
jgi:hypothetical protein